MKHLIKFLSPIGATASAIALFAVVAAPPWAASQTQSPEQRRESRPESPPGNPRKERAPAVKPQPPGETDEAASEARRKVPKSLGATIPDSPRKRAKLLSDLYAHLATAADEEDATRAAEAIEKVWLTAGSDTVSVLMERAVRAANEKKLELSVKLLDTVVEIAPDYPEAWNRRAYVHYMRNDIGSAMGDLRRVLALDPNHFKALDGLAQILKETGNKSAAFGVYKRLIEVHPFWSPAEQAIKELEREVDGQGI